jgi:hypothetical protein
MSLDITWIEAPPVSSESRKKTDVGPHTPYLGKNCLWSMVFVPPSMSRFFRYEFLVIGGRQQAIKLARILQRELQHP